MNLAVPATAETGRPQTESRSSKSTPSPIVRANADDPALEMELGGDDRLLSDTFGKDNLMMEITTAGVIYVAN
ncbi:MAG: hypothetical protein QNL91_09920, partial [Candidatus Krumholzibacteria bacterium]|nr:hypothetical protein [Candidatus Krumholzibacteria bacterium]